MSFDKLRLLHSFQQDSRNLCLLRWPWRGPKLKGGLLHLQRRHRLSERRAVAVTICGNGICTALVGTHADLDNFNPNSRSAGSADTLSSGPSSRTGSFSKSCEIIESYKLLPTRLRTRACCRVHFWARVGYCQSHEAEKLGGIVCSKLRVF